MHSREPWSALWYPTDGPNEGVASSHTPHGAITCSRPASQIPDNHSNVFTLSWVGVDVRDSQIHRCAADNITSNFCLSHVLSWETLRVRICQSNHIGAALICVSQAHPGKQLNRHSLGSNFEARPWILLLSAVLWIPTLWVIREMTMSTACQNQHAFLCAGCGDKSLLWVTQEMTMSNFPSRN